MRRQLGFSVHTIKCFCNIFALQLTVGVLWLGLGVIFYICVTSLALNSSLNTGFIEEDTRNGMKYRGRSFVTVSFILYSCNFLFRSSWLLSWTEDLFVGIFVNIERHSVWILSVFVCVVFVTQHSILYIYCLVYILDILGRIFYFLQGGYRNTLNNSSVYSTS